MNGGVVMGLPFRAVHHIVLSFYCSGSLAVEIGISVETVIVYPCYLTT